LVVEQREFNIKTDTDAKPILPGAAIVLRQGEKVRMLSSAGGYFSVQRSDGQVVKVPWKSAAALDLAEPFVPPEPPVSEEPTPTPVSGSVEEPAVWDALKTCFDPEIPANIVELGLIYGVDIKPFPGGGSSVVITMTLTAPGCEMAEDIRLDAQSKVKALAGVADARVEVVFDPPWTPDRMTEAARLQLGMF
jgi:probable FeS assembly SUF system protein SufT